VGDGAARDEEEGAEALHSLWSPGKEMQVEEVDGEGVARAVAVQGRELMGIECLRLGIRIRMRD
jgi:hypothetical protein